MFRKIPATDPIFEKTKQQYQTLYEEFQYFAQQQTDNAKRASKQSGKAGSYAKYLIRLAIFAQKRDAQFTLKRDFATLLALEQLRSLNTFKSYNQTEGRFPNATLNCFSAFVTAKVSIAEDLIEAEINAHDYQPPSSNQLIKEDTRIYSATKRGDKTRSKYGASYVRNRSESNAAKENNNYLCEINQQHETFITEETNKPYAESHHLIPMAAQDYFDNTIDFAANIACLCPTCHRKIHYARAQDKELMIKQLFEPRKNLYAQYGIVINEKKLLSFYGVF